MILALLLACVVHKVSVQSEPPGATVTVNGRARGSTPTEFVVAWRPHLRGAIPRYQMNVDLPGYRSVTTNIGPEVRIWRHAFDLVRSGPWDCLLPPFDWRKGACLPPRTRRIYVMVEEHEGAGTWGPSDVPH